MKGNTEPQISDYGLIGNCRTSALVSKFGSLDWCCFPYFDSPSYFAAILDRNRGGHFSIAPCNPFRSDQRYLPDTNVLETRFEIDSGSARLLDCFTVTSEAEKARTFCPPNEVLRIVEGVSGEIEFAVTFAPKPHYSAHPHEMKDLGRMGITFPCGHDELRLISDFDSRSYSWTEVEGTPVGRARFTLKAGEKRIFSLFYHQTAPAIIPALGDCALLRLARTVEFWKEWVSRHTYRGEYEAEVKRSALILKLMTFAPSGAVMAAPTTSLPEVIGGERNWDYRFGWLRDASFTMKALMKLGYVDEAKAYLNWMLDTGAASKNDYKILYSLFGATSAQERDLPWFSGFRGSKPVRVGNAAQAQFQLDIYGEVLDSVLTYVQEGKAPLDGEMRRFLLGMAVQVSKHWEQPDDGIWEPRAARSHHVHSKVMAWVAMDRLSKLCRIFGWKTNQFQSYESTADAIRASIETYGFSSEINSYTQTYGSHFLDSSVLIMPMMGFSDPHSERFKATIQAIRKSLGQGDLLYRYLEQDDGLQGKEGCFAICTPWLVEALAATGDFQEAHRIFDKFLARSNPQGLWPEEIDPHTGEFLGNYPQAFTHIGIINAAVALSEINARMPIKERIAK